MKFILKKGKKESELFVQVQVYNCEYVIKKKNMIFQFTSMGVL